MMKKQNLNDLPPYVYKKGEHDDDSQFFTLEFSYLMKLAKGIG